METESLIAVLRYGEKTMIRFMAVFTFLLIVGVCSYVILNPESYSTLVLCLAGFVQSVAILAVAPVWKVYLSDHYTNPRKRLVAPIGRNH
jgi:hypothetical protein